MLIVIVDPVGDLATNEKSVEDIPELEEEPRRLHMPSHVRRAGTMYICKCINIVYLYTSYFDSVESLYY